MKATTAAALSCTLALCCARAARAAVVTFGTGANQFNMEFTPIGNPANPPDTTGTPVIVGAVPYSFAIGKYEVTRDMITKANAEGALGITLSDLTSLGGNGVNRPATGTSWNEAARFVNWLNTSQGFTAAYKFAAQPGGAGYNANANILLWQATDPGFDAANPFRNTLARYALPNVDEWYKAAYYDPTLGVYYDYPTGSNTAPTSVNSGTAAATAVYNFGLTHGPADVDQAGGLSPYGTMGQGGNAHEWNETESDLVNNSPTGERIERGGAWDTNASIMLAANRFTDLATSSFDDVGFRVTSVPEPTALLSAGLTLAALALSTRTTRRRS